MEEMLGYRHREYAYSLSEFGTPVALDKSKGWVLARSIPRDSTFIDLMGCYPLFCCSNWEALRDDLRACEEKYVSCVAVADPFGKYDENILRSCFPDLMICFKQHFTVNLAKKPSKFVSSHHRRNAMKGLSSVAVEISENPFELLEEWHALYKVLIDVHDIKGVARFSKQTFEKQLKIPGMRAVYAVKDGVIIGMALFIISEDDIAYYHLGAYTDLGYTTKASFAIFWTALNYFGDNRISTVNLGGGAGISENGEGGLTRFKRGWSTESRSAYLCGRILNRQAYRELSNSVCRPDYFPNYRSCETQK